MGLAVRADAAVADQAQRSSPNRPLAIVLGAATAFYATFIWRTSWVVDGHRRFSLFDDAMISMSYARTLADGHGLVWYDGAPRVEGFTNPLWVGIMAVLHAVGLSGSGAALAVMVLGAVLCLTTAVLAVVISRELTDTTPTIEAAVGGVVAFSYPLVFWSLRGMEVGLVTALALGAVWCALRLAPARPAEHDRHRRNALWLGVVLALGVTTRLDFLVIAIVVLAWIGVRTPRSAWKAILLSPLAILGASLAAQELVRHAYYGAWTPNTYVLKTAGVPLLDRLTRGGWVAVATLLGSLLAPLLVVLLAARRNRLTRPSGLALLVLVSSALVAYSTFVGGDAWEWMAHPNRYLVPAAVLCLVAAAVAATDLLRDPPVRARALATGLTRIGAVALLGPWAALTVIWASGIGLETRLPLDGPAGPLLVVAMACLALLALRRVADAVTTDPHPKAAIFVIGVLALGANVVPYLQWADDGGAYRSFDQASADVGTLVGEVTQPDARVAVSAAGAVIYYSERPGIDLLGKSDAHIAALPSRGRFLPGHTKWDYRYSIVELQPDLVTTLLHPTAADLELLADNGYAAVTVDTLVPPSGEMPSVVWFARSASPRLDWDRLVPVPDDQAAEYFGT